MRIAYLTTRFPKLSETFIANEAVAVRRAGYQVSMYAFVEERVATRHPAAEELSTHAHYPELRRVLRDQWYWLRRSPRRYARVWRRVIAGNLRSPKFLARAVVATPVAASFARAMATDRVDHVHAHYATHSALGAYVVRQLTDIPYSFTAHAHDIQVDRTMLAEKIREAEFVATISEFNARALEHEGGDRRKLHVVRCGVDPERFAPREAGRIGDPFRIAIVASLERRKGHRVLFDAVRRLVDEGVALRVDVVGDGPDAADVAHVVERLGLDDVVHLRGGLPAPQVADVLRSADAFALPSLTERSGKMEGIPVALMEAMAVGLPVIATRMSGIPELILDGRTGFLITEGSDRELADRLLRLIHEPDLARRLGDAGRRHVADEFDQQRNVARLMELFQGRRPSPGEPPTGFPPPGDGNPRTDTTSNPRPRTTRTQGART